MTEEKKNKLWFWVRFAGWVVSFLAIPITFLCYRFDLGGKTTSLKLSGWGLMIIILVFSFFALLLKYFLQMKAYSYWKQILKGLLFPILPLVAIWFALYNLQDRIGELIQFIGVLTCSEALACIVNPMPKWVYEQTKGEQESIVDYIFEKRSEKK